MRLETSSRIAKSALALRMMLTNFLLPTQNDGGKRHAKPIGAANRNHKVCLLVHHQNSENNSGHYTQRKN
jgi:hypothetical protein